MIPASLLSSIPGVLDVQGPITSPRCVVYDSPHSGLDLPRDFHPAVDQEMVLKASDSYVDELFAHAPHTGSPLLRALFPRSFLDVNRAENDVDLAMIEGHWPYPVAGSSAAQRGMGLAWRFAWGDTLMHDRLLTVAEMQNRIDQYWAPYHNRLKALLDQTYQAFGRVYHINCHSMPAFGHALSPDPAGTRRPDFVIGDFDGQSAERSFVDMIKTSLSDMGYDVVLNKPFRGAELIRRYCDPARGRHSVQIEVNRALYMDEATRAKSAGFARIQSDLAKLSENVEGYAASALKG